MNEVDSSDDEWVITSSSRLRTTGNLPTVKPQPPSSTPIRLSRPLPPKVLSLRPGCLTDRDLLLICSQLDSDALVSQLVNVYTNSETYLSMREKEATEQTFQWRLAECLHDCPDPCTFIQQFLLSLGCYFDQYSGRQNLSPKFQRLLAQAACSALSVFLDTKPAFYRHKKSAESVDLITLEDEEPEPNLISFDEVDSEVEQENDGDDDEEDDDEGEDDEDNTDEPVATITLAQLLDVPPEIAERYKLTKAHQEACINMIDSTPTPALVFFAMDVFRLAPLLCFGGEYEQQGVRLCEQLVLHANYNEAISSIRKLDLYDRFPIEQFADRLLSLGQGNLLSVLVKDDKAREQQLLEYVNIQLRYTFAGQLGIVEPDLLMDVAEDEKRAPPLPRLKERRFQKSLFTCASKVAPQLKREDQSCYFIWLSQRYAGLRWIVGQRAQQQAEEDDLSIEASSNYNGLLEVVASKDTALAKLAIKELVDICDPFAPAYFASKLGQEEFYRRYKSLSIGQRTAGVIKGEQMTLHRNTFAPRKGSPTTNNGSVSPSTSPSQSSSQYYCLPSHSYWMMVDSTASLQQMEHILANTTLVGLDTEWIPQFAHSGKPRTALVQIASDYKQAAFLVDVKTLLEPANADLLLRMERALANMFEDSRILKLAYDFSGDLSLLHHTLPRSKAWKISNMLDINNVQVKGGLSGVVTKFLGVALNKKQQLSNWEQRPLTQEQANYAAGDSFCLLDIYAAMKAQNHPLLKSLPSSPLPAQFPATIPKTHALNNKSDDLQETTFVYASIPRTPSPLMTTLPH